MSYVQLAYLHLATILPAFVLGTYLLLKPKGTKPHKLLGKIYMLLMLATALVTLFMPARVGTRLFDHFGFIHAFSVWTLFSVTGGYVAIRYGNIEGHKYAMIGLYCGGILIAGSLAFEPGRLIHGWLFG